MFFRVRNNLANIEIIEENPMNRKFVVRLTAEEHDQLVNMVSKGKAAAYKIKHANILLKADASQSWSDQEICHGFACSLTMVGSVKRRFVEEGLEAALIRKAQSRPSRFPILDGEKEARLIALACSKPAAGRASWTLRLLADQMIALDIVESISYETVRVGLKKTNYGPI